MICKDLEKNRNQLIKIFNNTSDLVLYEFNSLCNIRGMLVYLEELVDKNGIHDGLLRPLIQNLACSEAILSVVTIPGGEEVDNMDKISQAILTGKTTLFMEGTNKAYVFDLTYLEGRAVGEPKNERVIKGPRAGFIEDINVNKSLIRRIIKNPNLVFEDYILGAVTNTNISLVYINDIVDPSILEEVRQRIKKIDLPAVLDSSYIQQSISDSPKSVIGTVSYTERPDVAAGKILEARVGIICDGSPMVLTVPRLFIEELQSPEDYYTKPQYARYLGMIRLLALIIATVLPGFVVALKTFHHEMIPTRLLISMASGREGVPFTSLIEALLMILFFEFMKESSLRIPGNIGPAVSTISGLVLGQTAVQAGLVGPIMVITIATMGIAEFILPDEKEMIVLYRYILLFLGGFLGLFGMLCGLTIMVIHLVSLRSFGLPFMYPIAPYNKKAMRDLLGRRPLWEMNYRPADINKNCSEGGDGLDERK